MPENDKKDQKTSGSSPGTFLSWKGTLERLNDVTSLTPAGMINRFYGPQVRGSVRDAVAQTVESAIGLFNSEQGEVAGDKFRTAWNRVAHHVDGLYDFRMAKGWKMPEGVAYNGKLPSEAGYKGPKVGNPIDSFFSLFLRNKDGRIEVIDKNDARFAQIMGPYAVTQVGIAATVGAKGLTSIRSAFTAAEGSLARTQTVASLSLASADAWGGGKMLAQTLGRTLILEPDAVKRFANIFQNPEKLTLDQIRDDLNLVLHQFSKKTGENTAQYYIPPVTKAADVLQLLDQASKGQVRGFERRDPFAEIPKSAEKQDITISNIREVMESPDFKRNFYKLAASALTGKPLNPAEHMALRFGLNVIYSQKDFTLAGSGVTQAQYTEADYRQTMKLLREELTVPIFRDKVIDYERRTTPNQTDEELNQKVISFELGWREGTKTSLVPDADLVKNLQEKISGLDKEIAAKNHGAKSPMIQSRMDNPFSFN